MEDLIEFLLGEVVEVVIVDYVIDVVILKFCKFGENSIECCFGFFFWIKIVYKVVEMNCEGKIIFFILSLYCFLNFNKSVMVVVRNV